MQIKVVKTYLLWVKHQTIDLVLHQPEKKSIVKTLTTIFHQLLFKTKALSQKVLTKAPSKHLDF